MRLALPVAVLLLGCAGSPPPPATTPPPATAPEGVEVEAAEISGSELVVENAYPMPQHVFVDGTLLGSIAEGEEATFELTPGAHEIVSADSEDPDDNPVRWTLEADSGFRYRWRVYVREEGR